MIYDNRTCTLGEGPLWHPEREELFWFDILERKLLTRETEWTFDDYVSAAGWVDDDRLLIASSTALSLFTLSTGAMEVVCPLEADNPVTRSNDGRADPAGGFWIGTMGRKAEAGAGSIYRYYKGEVRTLYDGITVSNAICFSPDGLWAYFTDTPTQKIMRVALDGEGWPKGDTATWLDLSGTDWLPDGAVCDADGNLWNAQWGAYRVACYAPDGSFTEAIGFGAAQTSCPAFGGPGLSTLFCTSAADGIEDSVNPHHGKTFASETRASGQAEHRVML